MARTALICGANSKIVREFLKLWAQPGDEIFLLGRCLASLKETSEDLLGRCEAKSTVIECDFLDSNISHILAQILDKKSSWDLVLVGYGLLIPQDVCEVDPEMLNLQITSNFTSQAIVLCKVSQYLKQQTSGTLIAISSVAGDRGRRSNYIYGAAKGGLNILMEGLNHQLKNIKVFLIKPGMVDTPMTKNLNIKGPLASPKKVAQDMIRGINSRSFVIYTPKIWQILMLIIRAIPHRIFSYISI